MPKISSSHLSLGGAKGGAKVPGTPPKEPRQRSFSVGDKLNLIEVSQNVSEKQLKESAIFRAYALPKNISSIPDDKK